MADPGVLFTEFGFMGSEFTGSGFTGSELTEPVPVAADVPVRHPAAGDHPAATLRDNGGAAASAAGFAIVPGPVAVPLPGGTAESSVCREFAGTARAVAAGAVGWCAPGRGSTSAAALANQCPPDPPE